ncbi:uncharacterized protein EV420DRAFT_1504619 [Desarmillaria tabescens]|uniref:Uncharacterized protein n=1 Tax=Armillaria tabescens TaxID=1929756 RepID=A0AA39TWG5_ARMTA|nr:uncharacterized protein EV420DRAFT_1504619 [Desarmillaria tabescens]KAK0468463.1 hypothetical protein EV420DRAFT_1504619 [Desarmillaria tabescens]
MNTSVIPPKTFGIHTIENAIKSAAHEAPTSKTAQGAHLVLKNFFASWNHYTAPSLRAYILENVYDFPELEGCIDRDLVGPDRATWACLQPLAAALGFELYIAEVEYAAESLVMVEARPRNTAYGVEHRGFHNGYPEDENGSVSEWQSDHASEMDNTMAYHHRSALRYVHHSYVVNMSGMPVNVSLDLHLNNSAIINGKLDSGEPTKKTFAREDKYVLWSKTLILIIPRWSDIEISTGDIFRYTVNSLRASKSKSANEKETKFLDTLLLACTARESSLAYTFHHLSRQEATTAHRKHIKDLQMAFETVINVSMRWNDVDVFLRFAHACKIENYDGVIVDSAVLVSIYETIPTSWCKIKDLFADFVFNLPSNSMRTNFLEITVNVAREVGNFIIVKEWCKQQNHAMTASIKTLEVDEVDWMCGVIVHGDCVYFREMIFPQLQSQLYDAAVWMPLIEAIHNRRAENTATVNLAVTMCIQHAVEETPAYPRIRYDEDVYNPPGLRCGSRLDRFLGDPSAITKLVQLCIKVAHPDQCAVIFDRMALDSRLGFEEFASWKYYEALMLDMTSIADAHPELTPTFSIFFKSAISELLCHRKQAGQDEWEHVVTALRHCEDNDLAELFGSDFIASLEEHPIKVVARVLYDKFSATGSQSPLLEIVTRCLEEMVRNFLMIEAEISCAKLCLGCPTVRDRELYVNTKLAPLVFSLLSKMSRWNRRVTEPPFVTFFSDTVRLFARHCMPTMPSGLIPAEVLAFGCGTLACLQCKELQHFLCHSSQEVYHFTGIAKIRNHLEHQLHLSSALKHGVSFDIIKAGRSFTLEVYLIVHGKFAQQKQTGLDMLSALGDTAARCHVLTEAFDWVYGTIIGTCTPPAVLEESSHKRGADKLEAEASVLKRVQALDPRKEKRDGIKGESRVLSANFIIPMSIGGDDRG